MIVPEWSCRFVLIFGCLSKILISIESNWLNISQLIIESLLASLLTLLFMLGIKIFSEKLTKQKCLGIGDAKLSSAGAAWIGLKGIAIALMLAFISAGISSIIAKILKKLKPYQPFAFTPFISLFIFGIWVLGEDWWIESWFNLWGY